MAHKQVLAEVLDLFRNLEAATVYEGGYSGRAMFGAKCFGVTVDRGTSPLELFGQALEESFNYLDADSVDEVLGQLAGLMKDARTDSLGLDTIVYFPSFLSPDADS